MKPQSEQLGTEPIPKLLGRMAMPAVFGMFVMASYNVIDTIFVARAVGTIGVAAVSIAFPVQMIIMALAGALGIGGASFISRMLGANKKDSANLAFGNVISLVAVISLIGLILGLHYLTPILYLFGSSDNVLPYAQDYLGVILYGTIFFAFVFCMNAIVRSEGNAKTAMYTMIISAVLNVILTPIFIFGFGLGVKGSALGTVLAQGISAAYILFYFLKGKSSLTLQVKNLLPNISIINDIIKVGSSSFVQQAAGSIMFIAANHMLVIYGGDLGVAVFGIIHKVFMFALMPIMGVTQGLTPLVGYNYGANLNDRVSESIQLGIKVSTIIATISFIMIMAFPGFFMRIFTNETDAIAMGSTALRIIFAMSMTAGVQMITGGVFQALGNAREAFILSLSRQVLFLIPMLLLLPLVFGLHGVWMAFPISDLFSFFLALWLIRKHSIVFITKKQPITAT